MVGTFDGRFLKLYVDGNLVDEEDTGGVQIASSNESFLISRSTNAFPGIIDEVRIYNYARTPEEIRLDYNAGLAAHFGPKSSCDEDPGSCMDYGLVAYWSFDEGSGSTAYDASGNGNNGTINGAKWTTGKEGGALSFDGLNDYVDCGNDESLDITDKLTVEGWFKIHQAAPSGKWPRVLGRGDGGGDYSVVGYQIFQNSNSADLRFLWGDGRTQNEGGMHAYSFGTTELNRWYHLVATYEWDGSQSITKLYRDGVLVSSGTITGYQMASPGSWDFLVGASGWNSNNPFTSWGLFNGTIDEVRIYNRVLSEAEIRYHYNKGKPIAHWKFDEGEGSTAYDSTDNDNDGTIHGATWTTGKHGTALSFDGVDDYVEVTGSDSSISPLKITDTLTIEVWVKRTGTLQVYDRIIEKGNMYNFEADSGS